MPRLTWKDGETHEFVVIGKVGRKSHYNKSQGRFVPCTGRKSCWFCQHELDYKGVVIGIAIYHPVGFEDTHFPWVSFTPNSYGEIKAILGPTKNWYRHRLQLTRHGESFDTRYTAKDVGLVDESKVEKWAEERVKELAYDAGEEWGEEEPGERKPPDEEVVMESGPEPEEVREGEMEALKEYIEGLEAKIDQLMKED